MLQVNKELRCNLGPDAPFLTWLPRRAAWLYNRYMVREDTNLTPCEKTHMLKYQKPIVAVGEAVICRRPGAQVNKLELS